MTDLQQLLDQIDRLDAELKQPVAHDQISFAERIEREDELAMLGHTVLPQLAKALRAVMELHKPETRWSYEPSPEWGFSTKVELFEFFDLDNEPHGPADVTEWQLCTHCAEVEQGAAEDLGHLTALWPCATVQAITDAMKEADDE